MNAQDALRIVEFSGIGFTMEQFNEANSVLRSVVLELSAIKQRGEDMRADIIRCSLHEGCYDDGMVSVNVPNIIDYIIKGEPK